MKSTTDRTGRASRRDIRLDIQKDLESPAKIVADVCDYLKIEHDLVVVLLSGCTDEKAAHTFISSIYNELKNSDASSTNSTLRISLMDTCAHLEYWSDEGDYSAIVDTLMTEANEFVERYFPEIRHAGRTYRWERSRMDEIRTDLVKLELHVAFTEFMCSNNFSDSSQITSEGRTAFEYVCKILARLQTACSDMVQGLNALGPNFEVVDWEVNLLSVQVQDEKVVMHLMTAVLIVSILTCIISILHVAIVLIGY